jgi:N-hydroxyarylamine O-acetyltransferase
VLADFTVGAWWHSTSPLSRFTGSPVCSRITEDGGRVTLSGRRFTVTAPDGTWREHAAGTDEEVLALYRDRFGIALDTVPTVRGTGRGG